MNDSVQLSFRLPTDQAEALERIAKANDRTVSAEIRRLVKQHVRPKLTQIPIRQNTANLRIQQNAIESDSAAR